MKTPEETRIENQMKVSELLAMWWMHSASNGHCEKRVIHKGAEKNEKGEFIGTLMTAKELKYDAMEISSRHIDMFRECAEELAKIQDRK